MQEYQKWEFHLEEIQRLQREDETLKDIRDVAADSALEKGAEFFHQDGTYYRNRKLRGEIVEQLILPEACRDPVLQMAMQFQWQDTWAERKPLSAFYRGSSGLV